MLRGLGHFGVFAGLYVAAAAVMFWQMAGVGNEVLPPWAAVCAVGMIASGVYALDRVKIRDSWMDPADRAAQPERYAFIAGHSRAVRAAGALCIVAGSLVGLGVSVWSPVAGALAAAGVLAYAPRGRGRARRLKDVAGIKNLYVAGGIAGLGGVVAVAAAGDGGWAGARALVVERWASLAAAGVLVGVWVLLDAVLCDLDDATSDRAHGTATLPTMVGVEPSWTFTGVARLAAMGAMLACPWCPWRARVVWTVVGAMGVLLLRMRRPRRVRDAVDLRLVGLAGAATVGLWAWEWLVFAGWGS